jgi:hypothetical protein
VGFCPPYKKTLKYGTTMNLDTINQEIAALPPDAQQIIFDLVEVLKKRYLLKQQEFPESHTNQVENIQDWSDFIGCMTAEPDLSRNYKTYLIAEIDKKYDHR